MENLNTKKIIAAFEHFSLWKVFLLLFIIGIATYASSFLNKFVWDDLHFFEQNVFTSSLSYIPQIFSSNTTAGAGESSNYYRPVTTLSFALDHFFFFGWNPFLMHAENTLLHVLNGFLLFLLLTRLGMKRLFALFISAIFLVHPVQTEAVTYLSSRGDVLYSLFLLISLYCYSTTLYSQRVTISIWKLNFSISYSLLLLIAVLCYPLGILSKEGALTTPPLYAGVLLVFAIQKKRSFLGMWKKHRDHFLLFIPLGFIALFYVFLRMTILNFGNFLNYANSQGIYASNLSVRLFTFFKVFLLDVGVLAFPQPLYLERDESITIIFHFLNPWVIGGLLSIAMIIGLGVWELKKMKTVWIFFSLIFIFSNLLSVSGIIPQTGLMRENWLYLPIVGFYIVLVQSIQLILPAVFRYKTALLAVSIMLCIVYSGWTIHQNHYWKDNITYLEHNLAYTQSSRLHLNVGTEYMNKGDYKKALYHFQESEKIADFYPQTHHNLALLYLKMGKKDLAEKEFRTALSLDPGFLYTYASLVNLYIDEHKPEKAMPYVYKLTQVYPSDFKLELVYAGLVRDSGNSEYAQELFEKAVKLSHDNPAVIRMRGQFSSSKNTP